MSIHPDESGTPCGSNSEDMPSTTKCRSTCRRGECNCGLNHHNMCSPHNHFRSPLPAAQARTHLQPAPNHRAQRIRRPRRTLRLPWIHHPRRLRRMMVTVVCKVQLPSVLCMNLIYSSGNVPDQKLHCILNMRHLRRYLLCHHYSKIKYSHML